MPSTKEVCVTENISQVLSAGTEHMTLDLLRDTMTKSCGSTHDVLIFKCAAHAVLELCGVWNPGPGSGSGCNHCHVNNQTSAPAVQQNSRLDLLRHARVVSPTWLSRVYSNRQL